MSAFAERDYDAALAAANEALAILPGDPRALAERGEAHLRSGKYELADRDLSAARAEVLGAHLKAQILRAQAALADNRGDAALAARLVRQADTLQQARRKGDGGECEVSAHRIRWAPLRVPGFLGAWSAVLEAHALETGGAAEDASEDPPITTDAQARHRIAPRDPAGARGWPVLTTGYAELRQHLVVPATPGLLLYPNLAQTLAGRCGDPSPDPVWRPGTRPTIFATQVERTPAMMCQGQGKFDLCDRVPDGEPAGDGCAVQAWTYTTYVLDSKTLAVRLVVSERVSDIPAPLFELPPPKVSVRPSSTSVLVIGCGVQRGLALEPD